MARMKDLLVDLPDAYHTVRTVIELERVNAMCVDDHWRALDLARALDHLDDAVSELLQFAG